MNSWFVSKKLSFDPYKYMCMQLLHEFSFNETAQKHEDNGRGKIVLFPKDKHDGFGSSNLEMVFLTYEEAAGVKQEFDDYLDSRNNNNNKTTLDRAFAGSGTVAKG